MSLAELGTWCCAGQWLPHGAGGSGPAPPRFLRGHPSSPRDAFACSFLQGPVAHSALGLPVCRGPGASPGDRAGRWAPGVASCHLPGGWRLGSWVTVGWTAGLRATYLCLCWVFAVFASFSEAGRSGGAVGPASPLPAVSSLRARLSLGPRGASRRGRMRAGHLLLTQRTASVV